MNARCSRTLLSLFVVPVCWVQALAQEPAQYTVTAGNEKIHYVRSCERGYVVKAAERRAELGILAEMLFLEEGQVRPIGGLDRHGIWIVENDGPASKNDAVMAALIEDGAAEYVAPLFSSNGETVAIIPEIVIRVRPDTNAGELQSLCESVGCRIKKRMEFTQQEYLLDVLGPDAEAVFAAVEELGQVPEVEWAWPNTAFRPKLAGQGVSSRRVPSRHLGIASAGEDANTAGVFPDDEYFPMQWHLHNTGQSGGTSGADIRAPEAWEITTGDPNIIVAVLDTGVDSKHPDLINNLVPGYDFIDNDDQPDPALDNYGNAHGTACAGLIAAQGNNAIGVTGVTWNCKIMPVRLDIGGAMPTNEADIATAFRWAASQGADILSNSWGFYGPLPIIHSAIVDITKASGIGRNGKGCVLLFAAMNDSGPITGYPQKYPEVITVGATEHSDHRTWYSSYGPELDIAAPSGGGVVVKNLRGQYLEEYARLSTDLLWTTDILGDVGFSIFNENSELLDYTEKMSGTSGATPVAAGVAALILSVEPNLTCDEVRHFLERSAKDLGAPGRDDYYGWGRVDARAALDMVLAKRADLNNDWKVDLRDFSLLAQFWKTGESSADIAPAKKRDGTVDIKDIALMAQYWLKEIPEIGLFAHWKLDETEGETSHESVYHRDGTLHGAPTWQPTAGKVNGALEFDGIDDYVSTPSILDPAAGTFSVFAWIKGGKAGQVIISQVGGVNWLSADSSQGRLMTNLAIPPGGRLSPQPLVSECVITDADWHRVGFVWDGKNRILYVDDVEVKKDTQAGLAGSQGGLQIGAGKGAEAGSFWSGLIDDIRIYDRPITP